MSVNSKMTTIADEIRELSGTTGTMGLDAMATHIGDANAEVDNQVELLAQAVAALEGKASGGEQAAPVISVSSNGLITATAGSKSTTHQLAFQPAKTITPTAANQTAVSSGYYTGGAVTVKGDSNLVAGNIKSGVNIFGVTGTYAGSGGGDTSIEDRIITKTLTSYANDRVSTVGSRVFQSCYDLTAVSLANATKIGAEAFANCSKLTSMHLPEVVSIEVSAFRECWSIATVDFSKVTDVSRAAFARCTYMKTANFPKLSLLNDSVFYSCSVLSSVSVPMVTVVSQYTFYGCYKLNKISLPKVSAIWHNAFNRCTRLTSLYLTGSSLCKLSNSNAFSSTPIGGYSASAGTYGTIYVPASLLTSYKAATNWTYFSSRFVGI